MNRLRYWRLYLIGAGVGVFLALILSPRTRWVAASQALNVAMGPGRALAKAAGDTASSSQFFDGWVFATDAQLKAELDKHPNDLAMRWQAILMMPKTIGSVPPEVDPRVAYRNLLRDFPDRPEAYAAVVRKLSQATEMLLIDQEAARSLNVMSNGNKGAVSRTASRAQIDNGDQIREGRADVQLMLFAANRGAALDPLNGFFPTMAAVAHGALNQETDMLKCLSSGASAQAWNDYALLEFDGRWRLLLATGFPNTGATLIKASEYTLYPHLTAVQSTARSASEKAFRLERQGKVKDGLRIRADVMRIAVKMRDSATSFILVQSASKLFNLGSGNDEVRPNTLWTPSSGTPSFMGPTQTQSAGLGLPLPVLRSKYQQLANWTSEQIKANLLREAAVTSYSPGIYRPEMLATTSWQLQGLQLLGGVFWLLLGGLVAAGIARVQRRQEPSKGGLSLWTRFGYALAYVGSMGFTFAFIDTGSEEGKYILALAVGFWSLMLTGMSFGWTGVVIALTIPFLIALLFTSPLLVGALLLVTGVISIFARKRPLANRFERLVYGAMPLAVTIGVLVIGCAIASANFVDLHASFNTDAATIIGATLVLPIGLLMWAALRSVVLRDPHARPVAADIARNAPALAGLALALYGLVAIQTVRAEAHSAQTLLPFVMDETLLAKQRAGTDWTSAIPFPEEELR